MCLCVSDGLKEEGIGINFFKGFISTYTSPCEEDRTLFETNRENERKGI